MEIESLVHLNRDTKGSQLRWPRSEPIKFKLFKTWIAAANLNPLFADLSAIGFYYPGVCNMHAGEKSHRSAWEILIHR